MRCLNNDIVFNSIDRMKMHGLYPYRNCAIIPTLGYCTRLPIFLCKGGKTLPTQSKKKVLKKGAANRIIALVLAGLMLGGVLFSAVFSNIY